MKTTRDIVTDLWPLYTSGEASADTRALVEEFLARDPEFARRLREAERSNLLAPQPLALEPDHEMKTLQRTKRALVTKEWPLFFAILFTCFAFGRIVSDTSWDPGVSPWNFGVTALIALGFWIAFFVRLARTLAALK
jgi:anti-sigma factor RsiW